MKRETPDEKKWLGIRHYILMCAQLRVVEELSYLQKLARYYGTSAL